MRLFLAVMLPADLQRCIGRLRERLDWLPVRGTWTAEGNVHITVEFFGEVADGQMMPLIEAVRGGVAVGRPAGLLALRPGGLVFFPSEGTARVMGVGFSGDTTPLVRLQGAIEEACESAGFAREQRLYVPHATLARFRNGLRASHRPRIIESCSDLSQLPAFAVPAIQLMQSVLSHGGSQYVQVSKFEL